MATKLEINDNIIKKQLLLNSQENNEIDSLFPATPKFKSAIIKPKPGVCIKTNDTNTKEKVFINVCTSEEVPEPEELSDEELLALFESDNPSDYKVPMSLGQPHDEQDKSGKPCKAYDVIINPKFFYKMMDSPLFSNFFMIITIEGLDDKYGISLDKNCWTLLKNKKYHGDLPEQRVRTALPLIQELSGIKTWKASDFGSEDRQTEELNEGVKRLKTQPQMIAEVSSKKLEGSLKQKKTPAYLVVQLEDSQFLCRVEVSLPSVVSGGSLQVLLGEENLVIENEDVRLEHTFSFHLRQEDCKAFFVKSTKKLFVYIAKEGQ